MRKYLSSMKVLVLDMDGTFVDLYKNINWLERILSEDISLYTEAKPIYNMKRLNALIRALQAKGYYIVITTWLAKDVSPSYNKRVKAAKLEWLAKYDFPYDEIHILAYGTPKTSATSRYGYGQILADDSADIRKSWHLGPIINASKRSLIEDLEALLK